MLTHEEKIAINRPTGDLSSDLASDHLSQRVSFFFEYPHLLLENIVYKLIDADVEADEAVRYPTKFLDSLKLAGLLYQI